MSAEQYWKEVAFYLADVLAASAELNSIKTRISNQERSRQVDICRTTQALLEEGLRAEADRNFQISTGKIYHPQSVLERLKDNQEALAPQRAT